MPQETVSSAKERGPGKKEREAYLHHIHPQTQPSTHPPLHQSWFLLFWRYRRALGILDECSTR